MHAGVKTAVVHIRKNIFPFSDINYFKFMEHHSQALLIANPSSQSGRAGELIAEAKDLFRIMGVKVRVETTSPDRRIDHLVRDAIDKGGFRLVVSMGGDGTFSTVARGVCNSRAKKSVSMGHLPAGTANDVGRSFGIHPSSVALAQNIRIIKEQNEILLDTGVVRALDEAGRLKHSEYFFDSLSWGLSPDILASRNREKESVEKMPVIRNLYRDEAVYFSAALRQFFRSYFVKEDFTAEITVDGERHTLNGITDLMIKGILIFGGFWIIDSTASPDDGLFEILPFRGRADWLSKLISRLKPLKETEEIVFRLRRDTEQFLEKLKIPTTPSFRGSEVELQFYRPYAEMPIRSQLDGEEYVPGDHFEIRVLPRHLRLIVPENYHWI